MYISPIKNIRPSLSHLYDFQPLVLLPWSIEITFFRLYQQNKSSKSKMKFRQASLVIIAKAFLKLANSVLKKENLLYLLYSTEVFSSASNKARLFTKNFFTNSNLDDSANSLPAFPYRTNHLWSFCLIMLGRGSLQKTNFLLIFFLVLVKSFKNL